MKKIFVVLVFLGLAAPHIIAQPENRPRYSGVLRVRLADNYPITIALDGRYFQKHGPRLTVGDLPTGRHYLKVYTYTPDGRSEEAKAHLVFEGKVKVSGDGITNFVFDDRTGDKQTFIGEDNGYREPAPETMRGRRMVPEGPTRHNAEQNAPIDTVPAIKAENKVVPPADMSKPNFPKIAKADLDKLGVKVNADVTDTDKLKELQAALAKKSLSTEQLKKILPWLNFESSRVEFARWAFSHTADKQNFHTVVESLKYKESQDELNGALNLPK